MMNRIRKLAMVTALLSATASAQRTWVVNLNGGGDFLGSCDHIRSGVIEAEAA